MIVTGFTTARMVDQDEMISVSKIRKKKYLHRRTSYFLALRSFQMFTGILFQIKLRLLNNCYCLTQWILKLPGSFEIHEVRQYGQIARVWRA